RPLARRPEHLRPVGAGAADAQLDVVRAHDVAAVAGAPQPTRDDAGDVLVAPGDVLREPRPGVALPLGAPDDVAAVGTGVGEGAHRAHVLAVGLRGDREPGVEPQG